MYIKVTEGVPSQSWAGFWVYPLGGAKKWPKVAVGGLRPSKKKNEVNNNQTSPHKQKVVEIKKNNRERERKNIYSCWAIYPLALLFKRNVRLVTGELIGWPGDGMEFSFYMWWWWW
jgi:hypothetical protein